MLFIIEIILLIAGIWTILKAKVPLFISGPQYQVEGANARLLGVILILPLPIAFIANFILSIFLDKGTALGSAILVEILVAIIVLVATRIFISRVGQSTITVDKTGQVENISTLNSIIAKKAQVAIVYAFLGILGPAAIVACPLAFIRTGQALRLINEYKVGESYRGLAYLGRGIAVVALLINVGFTTLVLLSV
jgi:hypothetical protein